ncbi:platelet-activating factor acetylhydrolase, isoform II-domain-containing protein [Naematelia encephala]|uniref:1-alkyl-2-acetylglycerophosphocholine esterase n=1 Tax=Naematelia encephala TaxID=71784 RepID=A0A1Y2BLV1_9TREE|nr:platelet-activating factor acetylhydrolase, isoform II-domain-containing protein [Naematelia encephala]
MSTVKPQPIGSEPKAPKVSSPSSHSRFGTLWSRRLPLYSGEHDVGVLDIEYPIARQRIGSFRHKKLHTSEPAGIEIDTVLFSLFYPCNVSYESTWEKGRGRGALWFPRFGPTIAGFLQMAGKENWLVKYLAYIPAFPAVHGLKFPAYQRAPLLSKPGGGKWPVIIFSHGVGCSRLMYTHICGELASRGYVVAAVEHRDGTGPSTLITSEDGRERHVDFLRWGDLEWPDEAEQPAGDTRLRKDQLLIRLAELQGTLDTVRKITQGGFGGSHCLKASRTYDFGPWTDQLQIEDGTVCLAGHSFGGTAAIAAAADPRFSPRCIIALDPAVQRLEPWKGTIKCPVLSVNSEEFTDSDDYDRLLGLCNTVTNEKHILSIAGTTHPSFSDVFLIVPSSIAHTTGLHLPPYQVFVTTLEAIDIFLDTPVERRSTDNKVEQVVPTTTIASEDEAALQRRRERFLALGRQVNGRPKKPIGHVGEVLIQIG